jgi:hypothetical protein
MADEFFGVGQKPQSGMMMSDQLPAGMFDNAYAAGRMGEPAPEEVEAAMKAVRFSKVIKVKEFHAKTFDLSVPAQMEEYRREIVTLYNVMAEKRGVVSYNEKKLHMVHDMPKMIVHLEWYEYELSVTDHMMKLDKAGKKAREKADEKKGRSDKKVAHKPAGMVAREAQRQ